MHRRSGGTRTKKRSKPKAFGFATGLGGKSGPTPHKAPTSGRSKPHRVAPPSSGGGPYRGAKPGATRESKATRKKLQNIQAYQGTEKAKTKHQKTLAKRGKAIRKTALGSQSHRLIGQTPLQSLKHTGILRDARIKEIQKEIDKHQAELNKPAKLTPREHTHTRATLAGLRSEKNRLLARRHLGEAYKSRQQNKKRLDELHRIRKEVHKVGKSNLSHKQKRHVLFSLRAASNLITKHSHKTTAKATKHEKQAAKQFKQSQRSNERAAKLMEQLQFIPKATFARGPIKSNKKEKQRVAKRRKQLGLDSPLSPGFLANAGQRPRVKPLTVRQKQAIFNVPKQKGIGSFSSATPAGKYTRSQIRAEAELRKQQSTQPSALSVGITAAEIGTLPLAPELAALKVVGRAGEAVKATRTVRATESAAKSLRGSKVGRTLAGDARGLRTGQRAAKARELERIAVRDLNIDKPLSRAKALQKAERTIENERIAAKAHNVSIARREVQAVDEVQNVSNSTRRAMKEVNASDEATQVVEKARDIRAAAGAGDADGVRASMLKQTVSDMRVQARPLLTGARLRFSRFKYPAGFGTVSLIGLGTKDHDFMLNAWHDTHDLIVGFVPSTVQFATATGDAVLYGVTSGGYGSPSRMEAMWDQIKKTDPIALTFQGKFDEAYQAFKERPITGLIEAGGAYSFLGKGVGTVGRSLPEGFRFGRTGGRESLLITGQLKHLEDYSSNYFTRIAQVANEKLEKKYLTPEADDLGLHPFGSAMKDKFAKNLADRKRILLEKAMDEIFSVHYIGERSNRAVVEKALAKIGKNSRKAHKNAPHAMWLIATKIARSPETAIEDTRAFRDHIRGKLHGVSKGNKAFDIYHRNLDVIEAALKDTEMLKDPKLWDVADEYRVFEDGHQAELIDSNALIQEQSDYARWIPYAKWHMGAKHNGEHFEVDGKQLTLEQITKHAEDNGVKGTPAMITSRFFDGADTKRYRALSNPNPFNQASLGEAIESGTVDISFDSLIRQSVMTRSVIDKGRMYKGLLDLVAVRPSGYDKPLKFRYKTDSQIPADAPEGTLSAEGFMNQHFGRMFGDDFVAVNYETFRKDELRTMDAAFRTRTRREGEGAYKEMDDLLSSALSQTYKGDNQYVLVPKIMINRLQSHAGIEHETGNIIRSINREFKGSVLAFSPKWHFGNIADMTMRLFFDGAMSPHDWAMGRKVLEQVKNKDEQAYHDILTLIGGGHLASADHSLDDFTHLSLEVRDAYKSAQHRVLGESLRVGSKGYRQVLDDVRRGYRGVQRGSFFVGQSIERRMRTAALGKAVKRQIRSMDRNIYDSLTMQSDLIEELAQGLLDTNLQRKYGRYVNRVMGDYTTMSPGFRKAVLTGMPFGLWARASVKWALSLPLHSPVRTAMVASVNRMNEPERYLLGLSAIPHTDAERKAMGLDPVAEGEETKLPFYMQGAVPGTFVGGDDASVLYRTNTYTSFGPLIEGNIASFVFPQISSIWEAEMGLTWTGDKLLNRNGQEVSLSQRQGIALQQALETYVIPYSMLHQFVAKGEPDPTYTMFKTGDPFQGFNRRKFTMEVDPKHGKVFESQAIAVEAEPKTGVAAALKIGSPIYPTENFLVTNRRQFKAAKKQDQKTMRADPESEWLYGTKTKKSQKKDKRLTTGRKSENSWLYGK